MAARITTSAAPVRIDGLECRMEIAYRGSSGEITRRGFTLHGAGGHTGPGGAILLDDLRGYCHLRRAARTFRLARIVDAADGDGVAIADLTAWVLARAGGG